MSSERIIGTETEYGVYRPGDAWANPIALSTTVVTTYGEISRRGTPAQGLVSCGGTIPVRIR